MTIDKIDIKMCEKFSTTVFFLFHKVFVSFQQSTVESVENFCWKCWKLIFRYMAIDFFDCWKLI